MTFFTAFIFWSLEEALKSSNARISLTNFMAVSLWFRLKVQNNICKWFECWGNLKSKPRSLCARTLLRQHVFYEALRIFSTTLDRSDITCREWTRWKDKCLVVILHHFSDPYQWPVTWNLSWKSWISPNFKLLTPGGAVGHKCMYNKKRHRGGGYADWKLRTSFDP